MPALWRRDAAEGAYRPASAMVLGGMQVRRSHSPPCSPRSRAADLRRATRTARGNATGSIRVLDVHQSVIVSDMCHTRVIGSATSLLEGRQYVRH
jgi:hypothetical protein